MTPDMLAALEMRDVPLHDHVVIGRNGHQCFRAKGLL